MSQTRVFIWGSCVSRDTFGYLPQDEFTLLQYVARQSAISAATPPVTLQEPPVLESPFQQRQVVGDFISSLVPTVQREGEKIDLLLLDLTDERLGTYLLRDGTVLTRSYEFLKAKAHEQLPWGTEHLEFGSFSHRARWTTAITTLAPQLREAAPNARIVLLDVAWAARTDAGATTPASFGVSARKANRLYPRYVATAAQALGAEVVRVPPSDAVGATTHPWGEAPFHYTEAV